MPSEYLTVTGYMWKCVLTNPLVSACCARHKNMEKLVWLPFAPLLVLYLMAMVGNSVAAPTSTDMYMMSTVFVTETELENLSTVTAPSPSKENQKNDSKLASPAEQGDMTPESPTVEQTAQQSALPSTQPAAESTRSPQSQSSIDGLSTSSTPSSKRTMTPSTSVSTSSAVSSQQPPTTKSSTTLATHSTGEPVEGVLSSSAKTPTQSPLTSSASTRQATTGASTGQPSTQPTTWHQSTLPHQFTTSPQREISATATAGAVLTSLKKATAPHSHTPASSGDWSILGITKNSFTGKILLPIAIGILFSVVIIAVAYAYCSRKRKTRTGKTHGNGVHDMTSMDRVMLLADSSEDEF
ncbi:uncharacterized protein [Diadema antillarum]|uniref:uncharacterized protein n=1 Tax=Diadema antillarum TaxID=105358 RepID=UPI003A8811B6